MPLPRRLLALPLLAFAAAPLAAEQALPPRTLTVTAEGRVEAKPDLATITLAARRQATTAQDALAQVAAATGPVLERLVAEGISPADIQTGAVQLTPLYDYGYGQGGGTPPKLTGYEAYVATTVRVRVLTDLGRLLDLAVADGANELGGLSFSVADPGPLLDAARAAAVAAGRARAELLAEAAGVELGALLSLSEPGGHLSPLPAYDLRIEAAAAPVPIAPGEIGLSAAITLVYAIE